MANITQIPAPRVPIIDERTGLISREWFRFFNNLFTLLGSGTTDDITQFIKIAPTADAYAVSPLAEVDKDLQALAVQPNYDARLAELDKDLQSLSLAPTNTPQLIRKNYGSFHDSTTQTATLINTAYPVTFNTTDISVGVTRGTPTSRIYVDRLGAYNFQFSAQLNKTSAVAKKVWFWYRLNGVDATNSGGEVTLAGSNAALIASWNYVLNMNAGDYFELVWATDDTACQIVNIASAAPVPGIPSVILTVTDNISA